MGMNQIVKELETEVSKAPNDRDSDLISRLLVAKFDGGFEPWLEKNWHDLVAEFAESGRDRESDYCFIDEAEKRYYHLVL
jgi:hypothetical protein